MFTIRIRRVVAVAVGAAVAGLPLMVGAQGGPPHAVTTANAMVPVPFDSLAFTGVKWRLVGPFSGGRSVAAAGSATRPNEYYMGTTGGGVFKTEDGGDSWFPVSDGYFGGTIGAIAVAPSNPDVVYVGGGEYPIRGNVSYGDGVWKSTDAGKSWSYVGLGDTRQIESVIVDPTNPDIVYVGAFGHFFAPNAERGVFKSTDGGKTWKKILFRNDSTGVADMIMDPSNPQVLYVSFWQAYRLPWTFSSGGAGSTLYKTTDGGATWTELKNNPGLPSGIWGNSGLAISAANPNIVWALIEAKQGGLYKSSDAGATWHFVNGDNEIKQRAWYYMKVTADPSDTTTLYINNVSFMRSTDGGKRFSAMRGGGHGDSHHLWIAPNDAKRMIETDDGGARVTKDGGETWTDEDQPTGQFYHVIATNDFPYKICGAQQDRSTECGANRGNLDEANWEEAGGGESGWLASVPDQPWIIYGGSYGNLLTRKNMLNGLTENVNPWPDNPMGHPAKDIKYRFQWTFPIITSVHNPRAVYAGAQSVFKSTDEGKSWTVISPDLTYHDPATLGDAGGPLTKDQTSVEYYGTIFVLAESPIKAGELWTGSDDGKIYVTRDDGKSWSDATPKGLAQNTKISSIDPSHFTDGVAYVAANRVKLDDRHPMLWKTTDFGKHWVQIQADLPDTEPTRVVREDPHKAGMLFAGTERSVYFSNDDGRSWQKLALNLPLVPVRDLTFKDGDLIAATHGRAFWIMDNVSSLEQMSNRVMASDAYLFKPEDQYREGGGRGGFGGGFGRGGGRGGDPTIAVHPTGVNPPSGIAVQYWLKSPAKTVTLDFLDAKGTLIHRYSTSPALSPAENGGGRGRGRGGFGGGAARPANRAGVNTFTGWDMRYPDADSFNGMVLWAAGTTGPTAPPGTYTVRLSVDGKQVGTQTFKLLADPRIKATQADYDAQFALAMKVRDEFSATNDAVKTIRYVLYQMDERAKSIPDAQKAAFEAAAGPARDTLQSVADSLYQSQSHAGEDPLNYPIRLNNRIGALLGVVQSAEGRPTKQSYEVYDVLTKLINVQMARMKKGLAGVDKVNAVLKAAGQEPIDVAAREVPGSEPGPGRGGVIVGGFDDGTSE